MYFTLLSIILVPHALTNSICTKQHWLYFDIIWSSFKAPRCQIPTCYVLSGISSKRDNQGKANHTTGRHGLNTSFAASTQSITIQFHFVVIQVPRGRDSPGTRFNRAVDKAVRHFETHGTWQGKYEDIGTIDKTISTRTTAKGTNLHAKTKLGQRLIDFRYYYEVRREDCPTTKHELTSTVPTYATTRTNDIMSKSSDQEASMMTTTETDSLEYEELSTYDEMTTAPMFVMTTALVVSFLMVLNVAWCWIVNPPKPTTKKQRIKLKK